MINDDPEGSRLGGMRAAGLRRKVVVIVAVAALVIALAVTAWGAATPQGYCPVTGSEAPVLSGPPAGGS